MSDEIKRILKNITAVYDGKAWHGDNIISMLSGVTAAMASQRPERLNHSIAEIVCHMTAWRIFVVEKIKGNASYEVWDTELNWKKIEALTEESWQTIKKTLKESQQYLLQQVETMPDSLLSTAVDGRKYNVRLMLQGIVQHDIHHAGQISIIKKLVG